MDDKELKKTIKSICNDLAEFNDLEKPIMIDACETLEDKIFDLVVFYHNNYKKVKGAKPQ